MAWYDYDYDYYLSLPESLNSQIVKHMNIDIPLRGLKLSFGFVNTLLVLILIKPFQEPVKKLKSAILRKLTSPVN